MKEISISELRFIRDVLAEIGLSKEGIDWSEVEQALEITEALLDE